MQTVTVNATLKLKSIGDVVQFIGDFSQTETEVPIRKFQNIGDMCVSLMEVTDAPAEVEVWLRELIEDDVIESYELKLRLNENSL